MRPGGTCGVQQSLTADAATMVKQAIVLAKRRGHVQVTPLHVANTMLSAPSGLLRVACLKSHSHPLQCKALELCFNVALNRLPASSSSSPIINPAHFQYPAISNALVAAFKRAQAHQRRGSIENQQQALVVVKVELEQLIISILDDPSVSRVMREAGFSSTQVKRNLEKSTSSLELCSHPVTIPANSLGLSLIHESDEQIENSIGKVQNGLCQQLLMKQEVKLTCCNDCKSKFEDESQSLQSSFCNLSNETILSSLPDWLKDEGRRLHNSNNKNCQSLMGELCKKWNSYCSSVHTKVDTLKFSYKSTPGFSLFDQHENPNLHQIHFSSTSKSNSSSEIVHVDYAQNFKDFKAENLNILCNALEKKVPWQRDIIPEICGTILQCRSGMLRRKDQLIKSHDHAKEETWLLFLGTDSQAKEQISRELAKVVFGSYSNILSYKLSSGFEGFSETVFENPHRVFLVEDFKEADYCLLKKAIERGRLLRDNNEEVSFCDAIIILSCETLGKKITENRLARTGEDQQTRSHVSLDLNLCFGDHESARNVEDHHESIRDDDEIVESVDRTVVFNIQDL